MDYLYAIIFGVVQGITEFLPISSSGHLVLLHELLPFTVPNEMAFDVALHLASLLAVVYVFRLEAVRLAKAWCLSLGGKSTQEGRLAWLILLATVPAGLAGVFLGDRVEAVFRNHITVSVMLVVVALVFLIAEAVARQDRSYQSLGWKGAFFVGLAQAVALIPGTSRSGITIAAGLGIGLKREQALRFSFLMSIPVILGAIITQLPELSGFGMIAGYPVLVIAFLCAFLSALLAIKYFLRFARGHGLGVFAAYRILLALAVVLYFSS